MSKERVNKRARSAAACNRCKHRKQRCDNGIPTCAACQSAGEICSYENRVYRADYVEDLETRLADLERQLQACQQQQQHGGSNQHRHTSQATTSPGATIIAAADTIPGCDNDEAESAFEMLSSASYLGTSSGFPLARTLQAVIGSPAVSLSRPKKDTSMSNAKPESPNDTLGVQLIRTYLRKLHAKHAFMSPRRIYELHHACQQLVSSAGPITGALSSARVDYLTIHLIYAIGARYLQLSQNEYHCNCDVCV
jgi:ribosomal protein L37AE/L43A